MLFRRQLQGEWSCKLNTFIFLIACKWERNANKKDKTCHFGSNGLMTGKSLKISKGKMTVFKKGKSELELECYVYKWSSSKICGRYYSLQESGKYNMLK